jgi:glycosyltransferase involved in cell wall biosynthesis
MKVLHVVASRERRGAEVFASALVASLTSSGVDQRVAVLHPGHGDRVSFTAPMTEIDTANGHLPGVRMSAHGMRHLKRAIASYRPDVIQAHGGEPLKYVLAASLADGRRVVYRRIGDASQFGGERARRRVYASLMRRTARVVAVADALGTELVERFGLTPSRVVVIPNGVDMDTLVPSRPRDDIRRALGIQPASRVVLSLGALTWEKDPIGHLDVVAMAAGGRPDLVHVFAGDGPLREELSSEVFRRGAQGRTRVLGSRGDVGDLLAASDVVLLASRTEGMPAVAIEAGLAGLPLVGYALRGVPEVVVEGETGSLVKPGDRTELADALGRLLDDGSARARMGRSARQRCRERFDIRLVAPKYLQVYEEVARAA